MVESSRKLTQRKAELLVQSTLLREKLAVETLSIMQMPDAVSRGLNLWRKFSLIGKKPVLAGTVLLVFLAIKPRRIVSWLLSATVLFRMWRRFGPFVMPVVSYLTRRIK